MDEPSITYKITPCWITLLQPTQAGRQPCWASPLTFCLIGLYLATKRMEDSVHHTLYVVFVLSMSRRWFLQRHVRNKTIWCSYSTKLSVDKKFRFFNRELSKANLYQFDSCRFKAKVSISIFDYLALEKKITHKNTFTIVCGRDRGIKRNFKNCITCKVRKTSK
jgi:hypothetical protein